MSNGFPDVADLLPHQPPMRLIREVAAWDGRCLDVLVDVSPSAAFYQAPLGVPAWVGIEYLGQAAAAYFALSAGGGTAPPPGMIVSSRRFTSRVAAFTGGLTLVARVWPTSPFGAALVKFSGELRLNEVVAEGDLAVYLGESG